MESYNTHGAIQLIWSGRVCRTKGEDGLSIRKVQDVNAALFAKLGWEVLTELNDLWVKVVLPKYLTKDNFLEAKKPANPSTMWKYIFDHRYLVKKKRYLSES